MNVTPDVQRILDLPRAEYPPELAERLTEAWRAPGGSWVLHPEQAQFLFSLGRYRGAVGALGVGLGKTLLAMLASKALRLEPEEVLVLLPAPLIAEAWKERPGYLEHFDLPAPPRYLSFEKLGHPNAVKLLDELAPKAIICDEFHALRNPKAARTRRLTRYLRRNPGTVFGPMTGTPVGGLLTDYAHILRWALGVGSPLPKERRVLDAWSRVLDVDALEPPTGYDYKLVDPLKAWSGAPTHRAALYERLRTTPGLVMSSESSCSEPLSIHRWKPPVPIAVRTAIKAVEDTLELPDGTEVIDQLRLAVAKKQLSLGYYMRWVWPKVGGIDRKWLKKRAVYQREIRAITRRGKEGYETPALVERALEAVPPDPYIPSTLRVAAAEWLAIADRAEPETEAVWYDDSVVYAAAERARVGGAPTIIWYYHTCVGEKLAGAGVATAFAGEPVPDADLVALSIASHGTGLNLQRFTHNIVLEPPANAGRWEQMLGRTHRGGQTNPVTCDVLGHTTPLRSALTRARSRAKYVQETTGMAQKLVIATWT